MTTIESKDLRKALTPIRCLATEKLGNADFRIEFCKSSIKVSYVNQSHTGYGKYELKTGPISKSLQKKIIEMTYGQILPILRMSKTITFKKEGKNLLITTDGGYESFLETREEPMGSRIKFPQIPTVVNTTVRELRQFNLKDLEDNCLINLNKNPSLSCGKTKLKLPKKKGKNAKAGFNTDYVHKIIRSIPISADVELGLLGNDCPLRLRIFEGQGTIYLAPWISR